MVNDKSNNLTFGERMVLMQCVFSFFLLLMVGAIVIMGFWVEPRGVIDSSVISTASILLGVAAAGLGFNAYADNRKLISTEKYSKELTQMKNEIIRDVCAEINTNKEATK